MLAKVLLINAIETALTQYLSLDQDSSAFLAPLAGKVIAVTVQPFAWTFYLCPTKESIQVLEICSQAPDTTISGTLTALGLMTLSEAPMQWFFSGEVNISGDTVTGKNFQELFAKLDIDLEEKLSHYTGDIFAHQLFRVAKAGQSWLTDSAETFRLNMSEFLQDETRQLTPQPEIDIFYRHVDTLRTDYDRLNARLERLKNKAL